MAGRYRYFQLGKLKILVHLLHGAYCYFLFGELLFSVRQFVYCMVGAYSYFQFNELPF